MTDIPVYVRTVGSRTQRDDRLVGHSDRDGPDENNYAIWGIEKTSITRKWLGHRGHKRAWIIEVQKPDEPKP